MNFFVHIQYKCHWIGVNVHLSMMYSINSILTKIISHVIRLNRLFLISNSDYKDADINCTLFKYSWIRMKETIASIQFIQVYTKISSMDSHSPRCQLFVWFYFENLVSHGLIRLLSPMSMVSFFFLPDRDQP